MSRLVRRLFIRWPQRPADRIQAVVSFLVVGASAAFVFWQLHPDLILSTSTATGGDMGAHVWAPSYLRQELLPELRIAGWSPDWYAGFPIYQFYFVVPALVIVALSYLIPYTVAFKLVSVAGVVLMPVAAWAFGRLARMPFPAPPLMAVFTLFFLFDTSFTIYGGNLASTMAGEYSFAISLCFALVYLGVLVRGLETGRHRGTAAVLLALTGLCHVLPAFFAVAATFVIVAVHGTRESARWYGLTVGATGLVFGLAKVVGLSWVAAGVVSGFVALFLVAGRARAWYVATAGAVGALLAGFWTLPFVLRLGLTTDMGFERLGLCRGEDPRFGGPCDFDGSWLTGPLGLLGGPVSWLFGLWRVLAGGALLPDGSGGWETQQNLTWFLALAVVGVLVSVLNRRRVGLALGGVALVFATGFLTLGQEQIWNARLLPFWYLSVYLLAAVAAAEVGRSLAVLIAADPLKPVRAVSTATPVVAFAVMVGVLGGGVLVPQYGTWDGEDNEYEWQPSLSIAGYRIAAPVTFHTPGEQRHFVPDWARWNYEGYENKVDEGSGYDNYEEYHRVVTMVADAGAERGCGRVMWEHESDNNRFGTTMAFMLLPYWTDGCMASMEGLFFESSATTPYHFLNQGILSKGPSNPHRGLAYESLNVDKGVRYLQNLGVRYYLAFSDEARSQADANPDLERLAITPHRDQTKEWAIYLVRDSDLVVGLDAEPAVVTGMRETGLLRGESWDLEGWRDEVGTVWYQDPDAWDVVLTGHGPDSWQRIEPGADPELRPVEPVSVTGVETDTHRISFNVDRPGSPVLVKTSYFPNWKADGAHGPYRAAPNLMVVVPTDTEVTLSYGYTRVEVLAWLATMAGLVALVVVARRPGLDLPPLPAPEDPPQPAEGDDGAGAPADDAGAGGTHLVDHDGKLGQVEPGPLGPDDELGVEHVGIEDAAVDERE